MVPQTSAVLVGCSDGAVLSLSAATGATLWRHKADKAVGGPILSPKGDVVYVGSADGTLLGLDPTSGKVIGQANEGSEYAPPVVTPDGSMVFSPLVGGELARVGGMVNPVKPPGPTKGGGAQQAPRPVRKNGHVRTAKDEAKGRCGCGRPMLALNVQTGDILVYTHPPSLLCLTDRCLSPLHRVSLSLPRRVVGRRRCGPCTWPSACRCSWRACPTCTGNTDDTAPPGENTFPILHKLSYI